MEVVEADWLEEDAFWMNDFMILGLIYQGMLKERYTSGQRRLVNTVSW